MLITEKIFQAFLKCETKSYLKFSDTNGIQSEHSDWQHHVIENYKQKCVSQLLSNIRDDEYLLGAALTQALNKYRLVVGCLVQAQEIQSHIHALERVTSHGKTKRNSYIPIRFVPAEKITKHDKLLLALDALALSRASGKMPAFGKIIHGSEQKTMRVTFAGLMKMTLSLVERIAAQQSSSTPPQLILNKHCAECEFQSRCRQVAIEKDDLSLLSSMTEKERKKQHDKGIFTVTQLSYTFRPRRKPKRLASQPEKYHHALKALAIRERKIHIAGKLEFNITGTPVYVDIEGIPDRDFYYLIGLRIKSGDSYAQYSFWANDTSEEKKIWTVFLETLAKVEHPQIIHYGSYETVFLKRMKERYSKAGEDPVYIDQLIAGSVNLLSVIYAQIYFPTYSNGLKEIAQHLGFQWSESDASGLKSLLWRAGWESMRDINLKQKLVTYNAEDCEALERVASAITQLRERQTGSIAPQDSNIVQVDSLKHGNLQRYGNKEFSMPELKTINQAAYWNYQRERIYVRSNKRLKRISRKTTKSRPKDLSINKVIECPPPSHCPQCKATKIYRQNKKTKIIYDLKFGKASVKRWVVKYIYHSFLCPQCKAIFSSRPSDLPDHKIGRNVIAYLMCDFF